jgi:myo-inositol 2-dehydrogenase/D-chiro-inositol 1-dehydrogenase
VATQSTRPLPLTNSVPPRDRPLALGVIGCGRVTRLRHGTALGRVAALRVVAVADPRNGPREDASRVFGGAKQYADHGELLAAPGLDAVAVCVPAEAHAEVVLAALEARKHVFVEKPLCLARTDAEVIQRRVAESGLTLMVGFNMRHHPLVREAATQISDGSLGEVVGMQSVFTSSFDYRSEAHPWRFVRERGGGALIEMAAHHFDLWRMLLGDEIDVVFASSESGSADDETAVVCARTVSGIAISFLVSQRSTNLNECAVYGTRATLRLSLYRFDGLEVHRTTDFAGDPFLRARRFLGSLRSLRARDGYLRSYEHEWRRFAAAVASGRPEPDVEDGLRNVEIINAVLESASTGAPARVREERVVA